MVGSNIFDSDDVSSFYWILFCKLKEKKERDEEKEKKKEKGWEKRAWIKLEMIDFTWKKNKQTCEHKNKN